MTCPAVNGSRKCPHYSGLCRFTGGDYIIALCWYPHRPDGGKKFFEIDTTAAREVDECPLNTTARNSNLPSEPQTSGLQSEGV